MAISYKKLRSILNKPYSGSPEITDGDGLSVRISQKGIIAFQFCYRWENKPIRLTLGRYPALPLKDTRIITGELRLLINESKIQVNKDEYTIRLKEANTAIAVLQDIIDLDMQESDEDEQLKTWKKHRILLTRVDASQADVEWPEKPEK